MANPDFTPVTDPDALDALIDTVPALAVWFSGPDCRVCHDLKPRVAERLQRQFPLLQRVEVDCARLPAPAAQQQIFTIPALLVFFAGRETLRLIRNFSLNQLEQQLQRPYGLFFD